MIPAIFFTCDVQHAMDLSAVLRSHGVRVYPVHGKTPKDERKRLVDLARHGEIDGLASCDALTVGTDIPIAMMAVHARPTASGLWYRQATGRVLRPYPAPQGDRKYQREALIAIYRALQRGVLNQVIVMPTGTGKTRVAASSLSMIRAWKEKILNQPVRGRVMFSVHRDELAYQAAETFAHLNPSLKVGIEKADSHADNADIVIASIQTLGTKTAAARLALFRHEQFDLDVTDEAHFGVKSELYRRFYEHMGIAKWGRRDPGILHLGMTATPNRSDNVGLEKHYDQITYNLGLTDAIRDGWLCRIVGYRAETRVDLSQVRMRSDGEDFALQQLEKTVNTPERNELLAQKYLEVCASEGNDIQHWTPDSRWTKPHAVVLDCADVSGSHSLITLPTLFGFSARYNPKGQDITRDAERVKKLQQEHPNLDLRDATDMASIDATLRSVDLLAPPTVPPEIQGRSRYAWLPDGPGSYHLGCMDHRVLTIRQNVLGQWEINEHSLGMAKHLHTAKDLKEALQLAEKAIPPKEQKFLQTGASWRSEPPTDRQARRIWDLDIRVRREHANPDSYYQYCKRQYNSGDRRYAKGGMSQMLCALDPQLSH